VGDYEGDRAPAGIMRMTVDFGLLARDQVIGADIVRALQLAHAARTTLQPRRLSTVLAFPTEAAPGRRGFFVYKDGLLVYFAKDTLTCGCDLHAAPAAGPTKKRR